jgi:hypothetical protein
VLSKRNARRRALVLAVPLLLAGIAASAMDSDSIVAINQFNATCVRHLAKPDEVRTWAEANYQPIRDPEMLAVIVGRVTGGGAWRLPSPTGRDLTLSLRGDGKTCAIWSEAADPDAVETEFRKMVAGAARTGITVETKTDSELPTRTGKGRLLTMAVTDTDLDTGYLFTFIAGDLFAGAPISLSMQMVRTGAVKR